MVVELLVFEDYLAVSYSGIACNGIGDYVGKEALELGDDLNYGVACSSLARYGCFCIGGVGYKYLRLAVASGCKIACGGLVL